MKPIIFNTEMVRAILEGRKTQTRRVIKYSDNWELFGYLGMDGDLHTWNVGTPCGTYPGGIKCPYGKPGDMLWVRETWWPLLHIDDGTRIAYKANETDEEAKEGKWKPSIHMPRSACRLFLKIKDIRVERVVDISWQDIEKEGLTSKHSGVTKIGHLKTQWLHLWDSINENRGYGYDLNPWVWVVEFAKV